MAHLLQATHLVWWTHVRSVAGEFRRDTKVIEQSISPGPGASCSVDHQAFPAALTDKEGSRPLGSTVVLSHVGSGWHCNLPFMGEETEAPGG